MFNVEEEKDIILWKVFLMVKCDESNVGVGDDRRENHSIDVGAFWTHISFSSKNMFKYENVNFI